MLEASNQMLDKALGAIVGGALGDAMGMPTQVLSAPEIQSLYGFVDTFVAPRADHPVSKGLAPGTITDDTEQALLLGHLLLELQGKPFDHVRWVNALIGWEDDIKARGSLDLLGPSTKRAISAINAGIPAEEAGKYGDTNGAAMRIGPVGILCPIGDLDRLIDTVAQSCRATHNTNIAISSAAAVAAAVSTGVSGGTWQMASEKAILAARMAENLGNWVAGANIASRIEWARELVLGKPKQQAIDLVVNLIGTSVAAQESVPAAFAVLEIANGNAWEAATISANLGGDTDTIGAISASIAGACAGFSTLPAGKVANLHGIDLTEVKMLVAGLVNRRQMSEAP